MEILIKPEDKVLELGGGAAPQFHPNMDVRQCTDSQGNPTVDIVWDLNSLPLPIQTGEFDAVFSKFALEHISWRKVPEFLKEMRRVLKPGGRAVLITPNTAAQIAWAGEHQEGWDGKGFFESASCVLFGDQDYPENSHRCVLTPQIITGLLKEAGFDTVDVEPFGERQTDMIVQAFAPGFSAVTEPLKVLPSVPPELLPSAPLQTLLPAPDPITAAMQQAQAPMPELLPPAPQDETKRAELFDKHYFNGGGKVGGYAREGYWDYPVHEKTFRHILYRRPESVLELGCARGYILKRLQDAGVPAVGLEISRHCYMTRVCEGVGLGDVCDPWVWKSADLQGKDLAFSIATFEHIPEHRLPMVLGELKRCTKRGLHGIDFGHKDDGFDKTHCTLRPKEWWRQLFDAHGLQTHEIVDKEWLEQGEMPPEYLRGDGRVKINVGSYTTMYHYGWANVDQHDLKQFAQSYGYQYAQYDLRNGMPLNTGSVDLISCSHVLEHFTYADGLRLLKEFRRVLKPTGALRIAVPNAETLLARYHNHLCYMTGNHSDFGNDNLDEFDEINDGSAGMRTQLGKLWALLFEGHHAGYDNETLLAALGEAGLDAEIVPFRSVGAHFADHPGHRQILRETLDMFPCLSLYAAAAPRLA